MAVICTGACSNTDCYAVDEAASRNNEDMATVIQENLMRIMTDTTGEYEHGGYIVYSAASNEVVPVSEFAYSLGTTFYGWTRGETCDTTITEGYYLNNAPKGNGWILGGTCKNKLGTIRLANRIANNIPKGRNFEIHAECGKDGTYTVWYRVL